MAVAGLFTSLWITFRIQCVFAFVLFEMVLYAWDERLALSFGGFLVALCVMRRIVRNSFHNRKFLD